MPYVQSRITEEAKFTSSLTCIWKTFEKQITAIEEQGEKQIKALEERGKQLAKYKNEKESSTCSKQIFEELADNKLDEIQDLSKQIDFNDLTYYYKGKNVPQPL